MFKIPYADINDAKILGEIHSQSWKIPYKGIVPDEILNSITTEKRQKYFKKALTEGFESYGKDYSQLIDSTNLLTYKLIFSCA